MNEEVVTGSGKSKFYFGKSFYLWGTAYFTLPLTFIFLVLSLKDSWKSEAEGGESSDIQGTSVFALIY